MDLPRTEYARTADGLTIAYQVFGVGSRNIVFVNGMVSHADLLWESPGHRHLMQRLGAMGRVAVFDKRGTGLSDRMHGSGAIEDRLLDLVAVMDAAGMARAHLVAISDGAPVAMVFAAQQPERVQSLASIGGFAAGHLMDPDVDLTPAEIERNVQAVIDAWGTGTVCPKVIRAMPTEAARRLEMYSNTPAGQGDVMRANNDMDVTPTLAAVEAPTLLVHCTGDPGVRVGWAHQLHDAIPTSTVVELDADFHNSYLADDMELCVAAIESFWDGLGDGIRALVPPTRTLATVMFTDIVDSTRIAADTGDLAWRQTLDTFERGAEEIVAAQLGTTIKTTGDGILATFEGPSAALHAAKALRDHANSIDLQLRIGLHTGEIEQRTNDIAGIGVNTAARAMAAAEDNQIWVTETIPGLVAGGGHHFEDRGTHTLKGIPKPMTLLALT